MKELIGPLMFVVLAVIIMFVLGCSFFKKLTYKPVDGKTMYMTDSSGRIVIYHGASVSNSSKHSVNGREGHPMHTQEDFKKLKDWGFNLVRYLVFWARVEPTPGTYDEKYIDEVIQRVRWMRELGIDVIIDVHQDLFNAQFGGNGFPDWATHHNGEPFEMQKVWSDNYKQPAVQACYDYFWKNEKIQIQYIDMLKYLMLKMKDMPNVIGFDVFNEPWPTRPYVRFEQTYLTDFYNKVRAMMMHHRHTFTLFFQPVIYTSAGAPTMMKFNPPKAWGVFIPHFYEVLQKKRKEYSGISKLIMCRSLEIKVREAQKMGVPLLLGEIGVSDQIDGYLDAVGDQMNVCDQYGISWCWWSFDPNGYAMFKPNGSRTPVIDVISRIYPQRIAGKNPNYSFEDGVFHLTYDNPLDDDETVIYVPPWFKYRIETKCPYEVNGNQIILSSIRMDDAGTQEVTIYVEKN